MKVLAFGEILWDIFGDKKELGGAPLNFCAHLARLGVQSAMVSAVGGDELGEAARKLADKYGVSTFYVGTAGYPTGYCRVTLNDKGSPSYELVRPVAYDFIEEPTEMLEEICSERYDVLYFGTLAQRSEVSRKTLQTILTTCTFHEVFLDVNIRQNYYSREILDYSLRHATILKVSREEIGIFHNLGLAAAQLSGGDSPSLFYERVCEELNRQYGLKLIIITLDKDGALAYRPGEDLLYSEKPVNKAVSTVGAGDSFSAAFLQSYGRGELLERSLEKAVLLSDFVVTRHGAIPDYPLELAARLV